MKNKKYITLILIACCVLLAVCPKSALCQNHIRELDTVRTSMIELGGKLPDIIRNAQPKDIRTLERVFEINNYALVTIESYLKMMKVSVSSTGTINKDIVSVLNGWLKFIRHYCEYDIKYFDETLAETKDPAIIDIVSTEKINISNLMSISERGIEENDKLLSGT